MNFALKKKISCSNVRIEATCIKCLHINVSSLYPDLEIDRRACVCETVIACFTGTVAINSFLSVSIGHRFILCRQEILYCIEIGLRRGARLGVQSLSICEKKTCFRNTFIVNYLNTELE